VEGQEKLRAAHALIVGAGGLGCPAALYLAASGIGRLTLADPDEVELTNLQRQILYRTDSIGRRKVDAALQAIESFNPEVHVNAVPLRLDERALDTLAAQCDVVLDCSDNFATRHAVNRACVRNSRPLVSGAAIRFDGQIAVFDRSKKGAACYACVFPESGEAEEMRCAVMGVFAPLTGIIGAMQAMEAIKLVTGAGETLDGKLLIFDAKIADWRSVRVTKDPECSACGASA
jgi:molybdopterin/thiamine biosynthesis adenylyltransferase